METNKQKLFEKILPINKKRRTFCYKHNMKIICKTSSKERKNVRNVEFNNTTLYLMCSIPYSTGLQWIDRCFFRWYIHICCLWDVLFTHSLNSFWHDEYVFISIYFIVLNCFEYQHFAVREKNCVCLCMICLDDDFIWLLIVSSDKIVKNMPIIIIMILMCVA